MSEDMQLLFLLVLPFLGSVIAAFLPTNARNLEAWLAGTVALAGFVLGASFYFDIATGTVITSTLTWAPSLGLDFTLRMDGFALMFTGLIFGIGFLVVLYARYYLSPADPVARFFSLFLGFMGSMLGVVLSGNLIQMVLFWELTSFFSFLLIGYWYHNARARDGARMALTVTGAGGLCLLAGVLLLGHIAGSYDLDVVLGAGDVIRAHPLYLPTLILILLGALTKSAQFPFHFWLPHAMAAPTPVSAYLHSATMVKAGVFLLARLWPVLAGTSEWFWIVSTAGLATFLIGAYVAVFQQDLKGLLAYSTISHLGLITLLLGMDTPLAAVAAIFHIMNHATFKASLFMAAGIIDHESGTRDIRRLSGLYALMPITATLAMVAAAAMAGVPLLNGFLSKEMFFAETINEHVDSILDQALPYVATVASMFSVAYSLRFIHGVFFGPPPVDLPSMPAEPPHWMRLPVELLVLACLLVGIFPNMTVGPLLEMAVEGVLGPIAPQYSLAVWHGFNLPLLMSVIALGGGVALYLALRRYLERGIEGSPILRNFNGQRAFDQTMVFLSWRLARPVADFVTTRRLQPQLRVIVFLTMVAALWPFYGAKAWSWAGLDAIDPTLALVALTGMAGAIGAAALAKYRRLAALILMGVAGLSTCLLFVWFSAPDLALTQLLVEVVTTILLLLGLRWLPPRVKGIGEDRGAVMAPARRLRDAFLAVGGGAGLAVLAYMVMTMGPLDSISRYFVENSYSGGGGHNMVNVILVDFRGFDTFGEITVLAIVALTVYALLRRFRPAPDSVALPDDMVPPPADGRSPIENPTTPMFVQLLLMRLMFPAIVTYALYLLLRGHDLPGGGFVAGLTMSVAFLLQYIAGGTRWVEMRLRVLPVRWIATGLLLAATTGMAAWIFGRPFLTSYFSYADIPLLGKLPIASALVFDLGVFSLVVGATVLMLIALAHQSIRQHRLDKPEDEPAAVEEVR